MTELEKGENELVEESERVNRRLKYQGDCLRSCLAAQRRVSDRWKEQSCEGMNE